jgi:hypothetical protein
MIFARVYAGLGNRERFFEYAAKSADTRDALAVWLNVDPRFDDFRADPRYAALLRKMNS